MTYQKLKQQIKPEEIVSRQHAIPFEVRKFAGEEQLKFTGKRGRGRANVPALEDIYFNLAIEGLDMIETTDWTASTVVPVFTEIGQPDNCSMAKIRFSVEFDDRLRELKSRADKGEFKVAPASPEARQVKKISLISLAVNLIQLAIKKREGELIVSSPKGRKKVS